MVATLYDRRHKLFTYANQLTDRHFSDYAAKRLYYQLIKGQVITGLPFSARPLQDQEIESVVQQLQDEYFLRESLDYAKAILRSVANPDFKSLEELYMKPPQRGGNDAHKDVLETGRMLLEDAIQGTTGGVSLITPELQPLGLKFTPNSILTIGGEPGFGKSALGEQILLDLSSQGVMCLDVSIELDFKTRSQRYMQHLKGDALSVSKFQDGTVAAADLVDGMNAYMWLRQPDPANGDQGLRRHLVIDAEVTDVNQLYASIMRFLEDHAIYAYNCREHGLPDPGPPVVMVDFIQEVESPTVSDENMHMKVVPVIRMLYKLAKSRGIAMIWIAQLRKRDKKTYRHLPPEEQVPTLQDFEGSGKIGQLSTTALLLHRPDPTYVHNGHVKMLLHKAKVRHGEVGVYDCIYTGSTLSFDFNPHTMRTKLPAGAI